MTSKMPASGVSQCDGLHCLIGSVEERKKKTEEDQLQAEKFLLGNFGWGLTPHSLRLIRAPIRQQSSDLVSPCTDRRPNSRCNYIRTQPELAP